MVRSTIPLGKSLPNVRMVIRSTLPKYPDHRRGGSQSYGVAENGMKESQAVPQDKASQRSEWSRQGWFNANDLSSVDLTPMADPNDRDLMARFTGLKNDSVVSYSQTKGVRCPLQFADTTGKRIAFERCYCRHHSGPNRLVEISQLLRSTLLPDDLKIRCHARALAPIRPEKSFPQIAAQQQRPSRRDLPAVLGNPRTTG